VKSILKNSLDARGANLSAADLEGTRLHGADLTGATLIAADCNGADLSDAKLSPAGLPDANLMWADLSGANLNGAVLCRADLTWANLRTTDLSNAGLTGAQLRGADLTRANLSCADLTDAWCGATAFVDVDLSTTNGLKTMLHMGPSSVGVDTLYKSEGKIPEVFLRGCGLSDWEIESTKLYDPSLSGAETTDIAYRVVHLRNSQPFQYHSCFISYSTLDQEFAERLHADLQAKGVRCWFAPHDIQGGRKIHEQIDEAIRLHDRPLLILSEHSMSSEWVKTEIAKARKRETKEGKRILFPVRTVPFEVLRDWECFDGDTGKDSAREVREYFIPDVKGDPDLNCGVCTDEAQCAIHNKDAAESDFTKIISGHSQAEAQTSDWRPVGSRRYGFHAVARRSPPTPKKLRRIRCTIRSSRQLGDDEEL
jgi:hypothetical protein